MILEDVLSYIEENASKEQKQNYTLLDTEFLSILSCWIKLDKQDENWQDKILSKFDFFPRMLMAPIHELKEQLHVTDTDITLIKLLYEAALRLLESKIYNCNIIQHKHYLIDYLLASLAREFIEHFVTYFLDEDNKIIKDARHETEGTLTSATIYAREIVKHAAKCQATSVIIVHNHPSGIAAPSMADKSQTLKIIEALKVINVGVSDHLIIGNGNYYSFAENNFFNLQSLKKPKQP